MYNMLAIALMAAFLLAILIPTYTGATGHTRDRQVIPDNQYCNPEEGTCKKGDWIADNIADCYYNRSTLHPFGCTAVNDRFGSWVIDVETRDNCLPANGTKLLCGSEGSNTRCVCSDVGINSSSKGEVFNDCKCQYWPSKDVRTNYPAFCTGYYHGGKTTVHHWACCNNCNDNDPNPCNGKTWQGGSSEIYCDKCGQNTGGGTEKYFFNCKNCDSQETCASYCTQKGFALAGLCWKWLDCFKGCCLEMTTQRNRSSKVSFEFCGDGNCSETETPRNCPIDCCYKVNEECSATPNRCTPDCCEAPTCCDPIISD